MAADERFLKDHAPGAMVPTASAMSCLYIPPERLPKFMPTPYSYALHLSGQVPFPDLDAAVLRRGRWLEPSGRLAIRDEFGMHVLRPDGDSNAHLRREAAMIPALCYLDDILDATTAVEYKSLSESSFADAWSDGPPEHVLGQIHAQMSVDLKLERVIAVPIIFGFAAIRVERFEVERDAATCEMIRDTVHDFVVMLRRGELPEYDGSEPSYRAWSQRYAPSDAVLDLSDDAEARWRAEAWYQARLDKADVESTIEAHRFWFSRALDRAGDGYGRVRVASLPEDIRVKRVEKKAHQVAASSYVDFRFVRREEK